MPHKLLSFIILFACSIKAQTNQTPTYDALIETYKLISNSNEGVTLYEMGNSDYGKPIYLCVLGSSNDSLKTFQSLRSATTLLINNAIHAGEPCGVNASLKIVYDYINLSKSEKKSYPKVAIIPAYNVGGMHNRNSTSRANQNGPAEYGFRGNAQNLDLNRDFIKMDAENMKTFAKIYHSIEPDIFIDTHTSNGADYQYTLTYIASLRERMTKSLGTLVYDELLPQLTRNMKTNFSYDLFPYIEMAGNRIDDGIVGFNDLPRYSMGYCSLFNTISFTTETHMLKPFQDRVESTYAFITEMISYAEKESEKIEEARELSFSEDLEREIFTFNYSLDSLRNINQTILFKGYEYENKSSLITPQERLFYDRTKPFEREISFYFHYKPQDTVAVPNYYVVEKQEKDILEKLALNNIEFNTISKDTSLKVNKIKISHFETRKTPYEGHYLHYDTKIDSDETPVTLKRGDIIIPTNQKYRKYILSVLSPQAEDSYFSWNSFDSYLQQKEYFSPYVFEEKAIETLASNPELKAAYDKKQKEDYFIKSRWEQLYFIYKNSPYYEKTHNVLPVYEIH